MGKAQQTFLFIATGLIALSLLHSPGTGDVSYFWMRWLHNVETQGIRSGFWASYGDYPPLTYVILFAVANVSRLLQIEAFVGFKFSLAVFLFSTSLVFWAWTKNLLLTVIVQLALILNSMALGYVDIYFAPTLILSLWALQARKLFAFTVLFSMTCLIKWQPVIIAPFALLYILNIERMEEWKRIDFKKLLWSVILPGLALILLALLIFRFELIAAFTRATDHRVLSGYALNFHWALTHLLHTFYPQAFGSLIDGQATIIELENLRILTLLKVAFFVLYASVIFAFWRREKTFENLILYALIGYLAYFTFNIGVHENHLFLVSILAAVLFWRQREHLSTFIICALAANANLFIFYGVDGKGLPISRVVGVDLAFPLSLLNVLLFFALFSMAVLKTRTSPATAPARLR